MFIFVSKYKIVVSVFVLIVLTVPLFISAQTSRLQEQLQKQAREAEVLEARIAEIVGSDSCFNYYTFGSVDVDLQTNVSRLTSGSTLYLSGVVRNNNPYPIVDGSIYVKIFRKQDDVNQIRANGHHIVDQFTAVKDIVVDANSTKPVNFSWEVPSYAVSGEYQVATYFTTSNRFNLLGLSFTDDVVGNTFDFSVTGEQEGLVYLDKNSVVLNDVPVSIIPAPRRVTENEPVEIKISLINEHESEIVVPVVWTTHYWDALLEENLLNENTERITLGAGEEKVVSHTVTDTNHAVYYVTAQAEYEDTSSVVNIRFIREGVPEVRLNFPSFVSYPIVSGEENTLFACMHSAGTVHIVEGTKVEVKLSSLSGEDITTLTYEGPITGEMMARKHTFIPTETYENVVLTASIYQSGELVDSVSARYFCKDILGGGCASIPVGVDFSSTLLLAGILAIIVLFAIIILWRIKQHGRNQSDETSSYE